MVLVLSVVVMVLNPTWTFEFTNRFELKVALPTTVNELFKNADWHSKLPSPRVITLPWTVKFPLMMAPCATSRLPFMAIDPPKAAAPPVDTLPPINTFEVIFADPTIYALYPGVVSYGIDTDG
jgi:hypothetical protein